MVVDVYTIADDVLSSVSLSALTRLADRMGVWLVETCASDPERFCSRTSGRKLMGNWLPVGYHRSSGKTAAKTEVIVVVIIVWLVRCWTLPFLRACSRLDSLLDDRWMPDQC